MFTEADLNELRTFSISRFNYTCRLLRSGSRRVALLPPVIAGPLLVVATFAFLFGLCAGASAIEGRFGSTTFTSDLKQLLNRKGTYPPRPIPFLRDYAALAIVVLAALSFGHFTKQWTRLEAMPARLAEGGLLRTDRISSEVFRHWFDDLAARSCRRRWETLAFTISVIVTGGIAATLLTGGLYPLLDHGKDVGAVHSEGWWARPANGWLGFLSFLFVLWFFFYVTIRHTIMGTHVMLWLNRIRSTVRATTGKSEWFGYSDPFAAPDPALGELRGAIIDVFVAILLGACAAACAVYAMEIPPQLAAILVVYLFYNLCVFLVPWLYLNRQLSRSKFEIEANVLGELRKLAPVGQERPQGADWLWATYSRAADLPERVIDRLPVGALVALYLIPLAGIIPAYR